SRVEALTLDSNNPPTVLYHYFTSDKDIVNNPFTVRVSDPPVVGRSQGHKIRLFACMEASDCLLQSYRSGSVDCYPSNDLRRVHSQHSRCNGGDGHLPECPVGRAEVRSQSHGQAQSKHASSIRV